MQVASPHLAVSFHEDHCAVYDGRPKACDCVVSRVAELIRDYDAMMTRRCETCRHRIGDDTTKGDRALCEYWSTVARAKYSIPCRDIKMCGAYEEKR